MKSPTARQDGNRIRTPHASLRWICVILASAGIAHFAIGIAFTLRVAYAYSVANDMIPVAYWIRFFPPYLAILLLFVVGVLYGTRGRFAKSLTLSAVALVSAVILCMYDFANDRCDFGGGGIGRVFPMWWWYYEPFFHGYKPGNA